jgi:hypothetical protein
MEFSVPSVNNNTFVCYLLRLDVFKPVAKVTLAGSFLSCAKCSYEHIAFMSSFGPRPPQFDLYYAAIDKQTGQTIAVGMSAPGVLADASERTGLPQGLL